MKKMMAFFITVMICVTLAACGQSASLPIDEMQWAMTMIQSDDDGGARMVGNANLQAVNPNAGLMEMTCGFDKSGFTIRNHDNGESWKGTYGVEVHEDDQTTIYNITFDNGVKGRAVAGVTRHDSGEREGTLIISADGYALSFLAELID